MKYRWLVTSGTAVLSAFGPVFDNMTVQEPHMVPVHLSLVCTCYTGIQVGDGWSRMLGLRVWMSGCEWYGRIYSRVGGMVELN
jgi:hypothetical protein